MLDVWIDRFFLAVAALMALMMAVLWSWETLAVDVVLLIIIACLGVVVLRRLLREFVVSGPARTALSIVIAASGVFLLRQLLVI
jgi:hypothetical protein